MNGSTRSHIQNYAYKEIEEVVYHHEPAEQINGGTHIRQANSVSTSLNTSSTGLSSRFFILFCIASWFTCSISLTVYNKWYDESSLLLLSVFSWYSSFLFFSFYNRFFCMCTSSFPSQHRLFSPPSSGGLGFPFPITVTCIHMFSNATLAWCVHFMGVAAERVAPTQQQQQQQQQQQHVNSNNRVSVPMRSLHFIAVAVIEIVRRWRFDLASLLLTHGSTSGNRTIGNNNTEQ